MMLGAVPASAEAGWFEHPDHHFRLRIPDLWSAWANVQTLDGTIDVVMRGSLDNASGPVGGFLVVTSEARSVEGTTAQARSILQEAIDNLSVVAMGFRLLEPATDLVVDGHAAAKAVFWTQPSTYEVYQVLIVVVGPEWGRFWAASGGMFIWDVPTIGPTVNASLASFDVLTAPAPPPPTFLETFASWSPWILAAGLAVIAIEGTVLMALMLRQRGRAR